MFYRAYQNISSKPGNMTVGTDGQTVDGMSMQRITRLITDLKSERYQPLPARRSYIPKKNGKKRPLGISAFDDKLVQEVLRMILEAIYESSFEDSSHGFRPNRSCHTAITKARRSFNGVKWFIEGDIKCFFDNIHHDVLIKFLQERIADDRFIRLIRKLLNAGYVENWVFHKSYSGTPQGGICSPILANVYLDKLDKYMREYKRRFDKGKRKTGNPVMARLDRDRGSFVKQLAEKNEKAHQDVLVKKIKAIEKERNKLTSRNEMDSNYKRIEYVRYADDFIIGVNGSNEESKRIKEDVKIFLNDKLKLELSDDKTLITHSKRPARFLSYHLSVCKSNQTKRDKAGKLRRVFDKKVIVKMPPDTIRKKLLEIKSVEIKYRNGKEKWKPACRPYLLQCDDLELLNRYNAEIRGLYNYYSIALNVSALQSFKYIMEYSMYKTYAAKYKTKVRKICRKYMVNKYFTVTYKKKGGQTAYQTFYNQGFRRKRDSKVIDTDKLPAIEYTYGMTSLIDRLKANKCELCGNEGVVEMHHIRKVSDIKSGKELWQKRMIARLRKTMAVCKPCHYGIHHGFSKTADISGEPYTLKGVSTVRGRVPGNLL